VTSLKVNVTAVRLSADKLQRLMKTVNEPSRNATKNAFVDT
jgi:hypothetical protein